MSLIWVVIGSICQFILATPLFMFAGIGGGVWNGILFILPVSCIFSAGIVIYYYFHGGTSASYLWYALPVFLSLFTAIVFPK